MKSWLIGALVAVSILAFLPEASAVGDYSRTVSYQGQTIVRW